MIDLPELEDRYDLSAFVSRARVLDETAVIRFRRRPDGAVGVWVRTPFDVLATRSVRIGVEDPDAVYDATAVQNALRTPPAPRSPDESSGPARVDPGFSMPSAWEWGALPPDTGFAHVDDVPARTVVELSRDGAEVARTESGPKGPPPSLLEQTVLDVIGAGTTSVAVPMRAVFAVTAMGFVIDAAGRMVTATTPVDAIDADEPVRVRATPTWARIDARFGSVYFRRTAPMPLTPI